MSDITKCPGGDCPIKDKCYRFTASTDEFGQSYFKDPPFTIKNSHLICDMFWGQNAMDVWNDLRKAVGDEGF